MSCRRAFLAFGLATLAAPAVAQFTGPAAEGVAAAVAEAQNARIGTYLTLEGTLVEHLRDDYYTFTDGVDTIRVEIEPELFRGREVSPATRIRIAAEVDRGLGGRYLWVSALDLL